MLIIKQSKPSSMCVLRELLYAKQAKPSPNMSEWISKLKFNFQTKLKQVKFKQAKPSSNISANERSSKQDPELNIYIYITFLFISQTKYTCFET